MKLGIKIKIHTELGNGKPDIAEEDFVCLPILF
ncbi:hypothetical protein NVIE_002470 [Nitrososphaera viennensis EN76]|uniref:Uncharacterized protein n=1 Tax=Nitrososphaera viennensis EN76 TaxID=926571 RepID=A0A060HFT9_9ARCH|nr:hypothetical protein NVIE_002470 [Nitrososphaera viennensis EN76]